MLTKIFWRCRGVCREIYAIRKMRASISGFVFPIAVDGEQCLPHWTYHSDGNRPPKIHNRSRSGKILHFMTLEEPYLQSFQNFEGIVWSVPGLGAPFAMCHAINVSGHPEESEREIIFDIEDRQADWTHHINVLLIERNAYQNLAEQALAQLGKGYDIIDCETIDDGDGPNILIVFSRNKADLTE